MQSKLMGSSPWGVIFVRTPGEFDGDARILQIRKETRHVYGSLSLDSREGYGVNKDEMRFERCILA